MSEKYIIPFNVDPPPERKEPPQFSSDEMVRRIQCGNIMANTRLLEAQVFINGLQEIRTALNLPQVTKNDNGLGERPPLEPLFDEIGVGQLQQRYLTLLDRYLHYTEVQEKILTKTE